MATRIVVNGREYASVEEMPADVRRVYEQMLGRLADNDGNGVPDILEGRGTAPQDFRPGVDVTEIHVSSFTFNGKTYDRVEDMPPDVRRIYDATRTPDMDGDGVPDGLRQAMPRLGGISSFSGHGPGFTLTFTPLTLTLLLALLVVAAIAIALLLARD